MNDVWLRQVSDDDVFRFYRWWTHPESLRFFGSGAHAKLDWAGHVRWFVENLENPDWWVGMAMAPTRTSFGTGIAARAVGAVRCDEQDGARWVSIMCDPAMRGRGYGTSMLAQACGLLAPGRPVHARIHCLNAPSLRAFAKAGFDQRGESGPWRIYGRDL